ncbi:crotonase/enoyl-CoA hydratase family protein [Nocardia sp. 348MFTsu5.1]|uniref:crotonase/enoyl-CoA hydratase family protein n=1 Tax=Nocardia sp. 348MFTsu5.1 TaxID=1172185 RepID=UPI00036EC942|nr:crotonase/enoyl-CoA hydratase family protein [Nocardia sp. 348MFTsu5.1]
MTQTPNADTVVTCDVKDGVAQVRLNRPDKMNALNGAMFEQLTAVGEELITRTDVSAVVLAGEGRAFCAGLDMAEFERMASGAEAVVIERPRLGAAAALGQQAVHVWSLVPVPVIAAVHGVAFGGGLQLALGADIRIVGPETKLSVMEIVWGLIPDMTGTQILPELVGRDVAKELVFTGRQISGTEALTLGLATRTHANPVVAATALATEIAGNSRNALVHAKALLELAGRTDLAAGFDAEQVAIRELIGSPEQIAVVRARQESLARNKK